MISPLVLLILVSGEAPDSAGFAAEAVRICVETRAEPAAVRALAQAEGWTVVDPATVPGRSSIVLGAKKKKDNRSFTRNLGWTVRKGAATYSVGLFDYPEAPNVRQCSVSGWDLDFEAVDAAFRADSRFRGDTGLQIPIRNYSVSGVRAQVTYLQSDAGTKQLHLVTVTPLP